MSAIFTTEQALLRIVTARGRAIAAALERALDKLGAGEDGVPSAARDAYGTTGETPVPLAGIVVCLPPFPDERHIELLLDGARAVAEQAAGQNVPQRLTSLERQAFLRTLRFIEKPRVHVPGVELIADAELSADNDPYLADHVYQDVPLLPAVVGLEAMGVPVAPGVYHAPDCTELTKIEATQLAAKDGFYELRITEELREITFADRMTLRVVDHRAGLEIVPNEMFVIFGPGDELVLRFDGRALSPHARTATISPHLQHAAECRNGSTVARPAVNPASGGVGLEPLADGRTIAFVLNLID